jgi:2OG-Fe(II) oxygenase superfamily
MPFSTLETSTLVLSDRVKDITYDPFCLFQVSDYLPQETYQALLESFPEEKWFVERIDGDKYRLNSSHRREVFREFCNEYPRWVEFFNFLESQAFLRDLYLLSRRGLFKSRGLLGSRQWRVVTAGGLLEATLKQPVTMQFEFSRLERGSFVPPHTDHPRKLVSLILYFRDPKWQDSYGGSTEFYRPKNRRLENNWDNRTVTFDDLVPFYRAPFVPNQLVVFLKSKNSYHGVTPITCPEGMSRNSLNINVMRI